MKQDEKIKKLATKLIRLMSDKKRLEMGAGGSTTGPIRGHRDLETEELIGEMNKCIVLWCSYMFHNRYWKLFAEDQQQRIRELERTNGQLKDKLMVAKQQFMAVQQQGTTMSKSKRPPKSIPIMASPHPAPSSIMLPSPTPTRYWFSLSHSVVIAVPKSFHGHYYFENSREFNLHLELLSYVVKCFHEIFSK